MLALDFIDYRNVSRAAIESEAPLDILRELSSVMPSLSSKFGLINLARSRQNQIWQHFGLNVECEASSEQCK